MGIKLIKNKCEIEGCNEVDNLHLHHIIERTDLNTNNDPFNLVILCPNHHNYCHSKKLKIIGIFPSTKKPNNRIVVYELDGKKNIDIEEAYIEVKPKSLKI
jgi:hypothetical protein